MYNRICDDWRCKAALLEKEMAAHRSKAAKAVGIENPGTYPMVVVPDDPADAGRQPQARKQAHIDFLYDLCAKTAAAHNGDSRIPDDMELADLEPPEHMASQVCAVCRGTCCHLGKLEAFLDEAAICRFIAISGICDPLEIVYAYFARLPDIAVTDACVYQSVGGCSLPRWMRADICNAYRCQGLRQAEEMIHRDNRQRLCVVVRRDNRITRSAFIRNDKIRHCPQPSPTGADLYRWPS